MRISHHDKYIFLSVPKTASQSIRLELDMAANRRLKAEGKKFSFESGSDDHIVSSHTKPYNHHATAKYLQSIVPEWDDYFKFAFVRNPWDRLVSCWAFCHRVIERASSAPEHWKNPVFEKAIRWHLARYGEFSQFASPESVALVKKNMILSPQLHFLTDVDGRVTMDFVGKMENLDDDFTTVCEIVGIKRKESLVVTNTTEHRPYQECYDADTREAVAQAFAEDIKEFGYEF